MTFPVAVPFLLLSIAVSLSGAAAIPQTQAKTTPQTAPTISFGQPHGFYDAPVSVALGGPDGAEIRYTLDGTIPSRNHGSLYTKPIDIRETTVLRAVAIHSAGPSGPAQTQTYIFPQDILQQSPQGQPPPHLPARWGNNRVDYGMDPRIVTAPGNRDKMIPALKSLPSFSLVLDPEDLFGSRRGVYSNPEREGRSGERAASLELIDPGERQGFQINCGIRIRGGVSSGDWNPKHAFRLFFRKEYGTGRLKYPVFGTNAAPAFDGFDLRCAQNHSWHMENAPECVFVRDQFNRDLQGAIGQPTARGDFFHLYLNGQYWGLYNTCERPEASYAASYFGGMKEAYDVIKTHGLGADPRKVFTVAATDGDDAAWRRLHTLARGNLSDNARYFRLLGRRGDGSEDPKEEVLLDPINLIDYMLLIFYSGNYDAPVTKFLRNAEVNNWHAIRKRQSREGFRFFIWDAEHALLELDENRLGPFSTGAQYPKSNPQWLWQQCVVNAEFRILVADRIQRHFFGDGTLTPMMTRALFDRRVSEIAAAVLCESARWGDAHPDRPTETGLDRKPHRVPFTRNDWRNEVRRMREIYFPQRTGIVLQQLKKAGFMATLSAPQITLGTTGTAQRTINFKADRGDIIYTLDGIDPREVGGKIAPTAKTATRTVTLPAVSVVKARTKSGETWSAVIETKMAHR